MKPSRKVSSGIEDLFRSRFENIINLRHELVVLGGRIAWTFFDETYEALYSEEGRPGVTVRSRAGFSSTSPMPFRDSWRFRFTARLNARSWVRVVRRQTTARRPAGDLSRRLIG